MTEPHDNDITESTTTEPAQSGSVAVEVSDSLTDPMWDSFVEASPDAHHVQTAAWGRLKASDGWRTTRIVARRQGDIVGGAQVLMRPLPIGGHIGYVPKAPVLADDSGELHSVLLNALEDVARERRIRHLTVQPSDWNHDLSPALERRGYRPSDTAVAPVATVQIDLRREPEEILAGMRKNHRRYVRFGLKNGMIGRNGTRDDLPDFHSLVEATAARQGFTPYPQGHYTEMWDLFDPLGQIQLFLVEFDGQLVSGQITIGFGDRLTAKTSGWSGEHGRLGPNYVMEWTTILWAREMGFSRYDLEGIDIRAARLVLEGSSLPSKLRRSHSFYKLGFGGEVLIFPPAQVWIPNPALRRAYWALYPRLKKHRLTKKLVSRARSGGTG